MQGRRPGTLIAFCGHAGSGKSEAAAHLMYHHGFERVKFAGVLKGMLVFLYEYAGLDPWEIEERMEGKRKEQPDQFLCGASPRRAMQTLGGEWGRDAINPLLWVSLWKARVSRLLTAGINVVVDDVRYQNEADTVRELGGCIIEIVRPGLALDVPSHPSEVMDFDADAAILNATSLMDLRAAVDEALSN